MMSHRAVIAGIIMIWSGKFDYLPDEVGVSYFPVSYIF